MVAVVGLDDAAVADGAALCKAPVVEGLDHLAGVDVLIEAAGTLGAGVLGVLGGQCCEALLRGLAGLPLVVDPLSFRFSLGPALLALGVLGLDQDVPDVDHVLIQLLQAVVLLERLGVFVVVVGDLLLGEAPGVGEAVGVAAGDLSDFREP